MIVRYHYAILLFIELELAGALEDKLDLGMEVSRIQLETSPTKENPSAALVVAHRSVKELGRMQR